MEEQKYIFSIPTVTNGETDSGPDIIEGTAPKKSPYTEGERRQAGFAFRMNAANEIINKLEDEGFDPTNIYDSLVNSLPFDPRWLENILSTPEYKQYMRAAIDFSTAQLRDETGAVINAQEIDWIDLTYFPIFGDDAQTRAEKREARRVAVEAMAKRGGGAYLDLIEGRSPAARSAYDNHFLEAVKRAKKDPEFKKRMVEAGFIDDEFNDTRQSIQ